ncbi:hypothetical protein [Argonema antarcticum]|nr:hypothetical protein [Argonema antarcticum]MCL1475059.1 hypothetical protein [Argonema antarcticum A004/B2]
MNTDNIKVAGFFINNGMENSEELIGKRPDGRAIANNPKAKKEWKHSA